MTKQGTSVHNRHEKCTDKSFSFLFKQCISQFAASNHLSIFVIVFRFPDWRECFVSRFVASDTFHFDN